jgi:hypothetical protein
MRSPVLPAKYFKVIIHKFHHLTLVASEADVPVKSTTDHVDWSISMNVGIINCSKRFIVFMPVPVS